MERVRRRFNDTPARQPDLGVDVLRRAGRCPRALTPVVIGVALRAPVLAQLVPGARRARLPAGVHRVDGHARGVHRVGRPRAASRPRSSASGTSRWWSARWRWPVLAYSAVNSGLVAVAITLHERRLDVRRALGTGKENALEYGTLGLGAITALLISRQPGLGADDRARAAGAASQRADAPARGGRVDRPEDGPDERDRVDEPGRRGDPASAARRDAGRRADGRPGPLQAGQRRARAPGRRPGAAGGGRRADRVRPPLRRGRPLGRRGVRDAVPGGVGRGAAADRRARSASGCGTCASRWRSPAAARWRACRCRWASRCTRSSARSCRTSCWPRTTPCSWPRTPAATRSRPSSPRSAT